MAQAGKTRQEAFRQEMGQKVNSAYYLHGSSFGYWNLRLHVATRITFRLIEVDTQFLSIYKSSEDRKPKHLPITMIAAKVSVPFASLNVNSALMQLFPQTLAFCQ